MIRIEQLRKTYDDVVALAGIDLSIRKGAITGLLGPNGAGKTTLVSILTGILKKDSGRVLINGFDLDRDLPAIKSISSIVPQSLALYPSLTIHENLEFFGAMYGYRGALLRERISFAVDVTSLGPFLTKRAGKASGGIQRRLNLAIGLLNDPEILYLDEPTVGVDAQSRAYILEMIQRINRDRGTTIIYTSHYISEIEQIAEEVVIIDHGAILLCDRMENVIGGGSGLALQVSAPPAALEDFPTIHGLTRKGNCFHLVRDDLFYDNVIAIMKSFRDRGIDIERMQINMSLLEDVYLDLTRRELRDEE